jgi:hypothetical protein
MAPVGKWANRAEHGDRGPDRPHGRSHANDSDGEHPEHSRERLAGGDLGASDQVQGAGPRLEKAGLDQFVLDNVVGNGFLPGVTSPDQIADPKHPCKGAVPRVHAHFFTADGQFGSLDFTGQQVDAGVYTIIEPGTVVIDNGDFRATFHYRFTDHGDTIRFYPVLPDCICDTAQWAVAVAYPGKKWTRVS